MAETAAIVADALVRTRFYLPDPPSPAEQVLL
jgi:hypothetical protein